MKEEIILSELKKLVQEVGSYAYYIIGLRYSNELDDINISQLVKDAGLTESMSKEIGKAKRLAEVIKTGKYGILIKANGEREKAFNAEDKKAQLLQLYKYFITNCTSKAKSITNYTDFKRINECIETLGLEKYKTLLDFDNPQILEGIIEKLNEQPLYIDYNERGKNQYSNAVATYLQFLYALQLSGQVSDEKKESSPAFTPAQPLQQIYRPYLTAIKSKPFLLLAGISGTGKSRIVRELARACWEVDTKEYDEPKPRNFEMIQVKPNWHDSSELLGYVSRVSGEAVYVAGDFLKFIAKAWENKDVPHFLCLDEMNLAPVEQYFAEYLSVIESRKNKDGKIVTDAIVKKEAQTWYWKLCDELTSDENLRIQFRDNGITIPPNLIVVGTVNMDETTFSFSRKVLDRAMTIEMNEVDLGSGLEHRHEQIGLLGEAELIGKNVEGVDVYADNKEVCDMAIAYLKAINEKLEATPFKVAYRTRNEFLLYVVNNLPYNKNEEGQSIAQEIVIARALDEITCMKILSRIEGDETKVSKDFLRSLAETIAEQLNKISGRTYKDVKAQDGSVCSVSLAKIKEMQERLKSGYTSFWS